METVQQMTAAVAVLGLLWATLWWLKRKGFAAAALSSRPRGRRMESLELLPLGPQHTLHLVRLGDTELLLAASPGGCSLLKSSDAREVA